MNVMCWRAAELGRRRRHVVAALTVAAVFGLSSDGRAAADLPADVARRVDEKIAQFMADNKVPGLSVAIAVDRQVAFERGYGLADIENRVPATADTVYRLASISKMLTAVAVMQLVEQGKLDLQAPIQKYVPDFPEKQAPVTAELLLKHQSGIRHYKGDEVRSAAYYRKVPDSLGIFKDDPLLFAPGEKFSYTTYGYNVLGCAIEGASGQDYVSYVQEHICTPAGMASIQPDLPQKIIPNRAAGYRQGLLGKQGELMNAFMVDVTNKIPGGGWCSTPGDLARFAIALADARLVSRETLERMWTAQKTAGGEPTPMGFGCNIRLVDGDRRVSHSGGQPKVSTFLTLSPARGVAVALMCNLEGTSLQPLADELVGVTRQPLAAK